MKTLILIFTAILISVSVQAQITWTVRNTGVPYYILGIAPLNDTTVIASSQNEGYIIKSTNTGDNWSTITNYPSIWLEWITFPDQSTGYTVGSGGRIYKSTNAGSNWTQQAAGLFGNQFYETQFLNKDTGWAVGSGSIIIKTTNGGNNWITQLSGGGDQYRSVYFINNDTGWVVGYGSIIMKTTNSGLNWVSQTAGVSASLSSVHFVTANTGYICNFSGHILKTTNGGTNWFINYTHSPSNQLENITFTDENTGWCVGGGGTILKTTNAGLNWTFIDAHTSAYLVTVRFMNYNTGWITGDGIVLNTKNGSGIIPPDGIPANLTALAVSSSRINLNWTDTNSTETGFKIERSTNAGVNWMPEDSVAANTYNFTDSNLTSNSIYHYRIFAYNIGGNSPYSNEAFDTTFNLTPSNLQLSVLIEGFYRSLTNSIVPDTMRVLLRNASPPYAIVDSANANLSSSGAATFTFSNISNGVPYFIQLKHRNSLETWSDSARSFVNNSLSYNFSTAASKAFGNNMIKVRPEPVRFAIYSGDVYQDGIIDLSDISLVYNDAGIFSAGYLPTDINGDNIVDLSDITITYNNSSNFIGRIIPQ